MTAAAEEVAPYVKEHNGSHICFADTLTQASNALNRTNLSEDTDATNLDQGHLMLFGVEEWKTTDIASLKGAMKNPSNTFKRLEIFGCEIDEARQAEFAETLAGGSLENIERLDIDNTELKPDGAAAIFNAVAEAGNIKTLNLQGSIPDAATLNAINGALVEECNLFRSLNSIDIKINDIKEEGCEAVKDLMNKMNEFENVELDMFYNDIQAGGARIIATGLQEPECHLTLLDLCCNNIGNDGAISIGNALRTNGTLRTLKLALNNIGNEGAMAIWSALAPLPTDPNRASNTTLCLLDMSANVMKEESAIPAPKLTAEEKAELIEIDAKLADLLEDDLTPEQVADRTALETRRGEIAKFHVDRPVVTQLIEVLLKANTLEDFDFTGIEFDGDGWRILAENMKSTVRLPNRAKEPMTIRFSIVDLMSEENLKSMEEAIWEGDLKDAYKNIDWRRRETPAE